ncbi:MAG: site-specific integrase [Proteobacteria bacterium]|nr:site-specific integrase [Pseudomonadota bacterium]
MGSIRLSDATDALFIDFRFNGKRCREYTALADTPANRKKLEKVLAKIESEIEAGTFKYEVYFPNSKALKRLPSPVPAEVVQPVPVAIQIQPAPAAAVAPTPLFKAFVDTWMQERSIEWRRSHIRSLLSTLNGRLIPHFGSKHVGQITKSDILLYRASLAEGPGRGDKSLSAKRINEIVGILCQILAEAAERFDFNSPGANVKRLRVRRTDVDPFSLTEVQSILATVRADYKNYFVVRFFTGMRTGEIHGLKWKYIDFERRLILVRETFVLGEDDYTKTDGSQRDIQMSQPVFEALREQYKATAKLSEYVFCNQLGQPLDNKNFSDRVWYPLLRHLGLNERRPYQMRHTAATLWLASGEAPEWIARQLGHTSTEMLFRVYSRYVPNLTRQDGSAMERLLASRLSQGNLVETEQGAHSSVYLPGTPRLPLPVPKLRGIRGGKGSAPAPQPGGDSETWSVDAASRAQPPPAWARLVPTSVKTHRLAHRPH